MRHASKRALVGATMVSVMLTAPFVMPQAQAHTARHATEQANAAGRDRTSNHAKVGEPAKSGATASRAIARHFRRGTAALNPRHAQERRVTAATASAQPQHSRAKFVGLIYDAGPAATATDGRQVGMASWYGGARWHGKPTSSGTRYDENALTAAHRTLPLGSKVRVELIGTGRSVVVTINDRPGTRTRVIDLSKGAAAALGMLDQGVARVALVPQ